jgi:hypothetical protein
MTRRIDLQLGRDVPTPSPAGLLGTEGDTPSNSLGRVPALHPQATRSNKQEHITCRSQG